jgi:hypothetical protein
MASKLRKGDTSMMSPAEQWIQADGDSVTLRIVAKHLRERLDALPRLARVCTNLRTRAHDILVPPFNPSVKALASSDALSFEFRRSRNSLMIDGVTIETDVEKKLGCVAQRRANEPQVPIRYRNDGVGFDDPAKWFVGAHRLFADELNSDEEDQHPGYGLTVQRPETEEKWHIVHDSPSHTRDWEISVVHMWGGRKVSMMKASGIHSEATFHMTFADNAYGGIQRGFRANMSLGVDGRICVDKAQGMIPHDKIDLSILLNLTVDLESHPNSNSFVDIDNQPDDLYGIFRERLEAYCNYFKGIEARHRRVHTRLALAERARTRAPPPRSAAALAAATGSSSFLKSGRSTHLK